jgi:kinesin family protein 20
VVETDPNSRYSVYVSFAEVYNEKIYDLLAADSVPNSLANSGALAGTPDMSRLSMASTASTVNISHSTSPKLTRNKWGAKLREPTTVKRKALTLKSDTHSGGCKYIHGLREVPVRNAEVRRIRPCRNSSSVLGSKWNCREYTGCKSSTPARPTHSEGLLDTSEPDE